MNKQKWYTVYDRKTDYMLCCGSSRECADQLGMTLESFRCAVSRTRKGTNKRYEFLIEDYDEVMNV